MTGLVVGAVCFGWLTGFVIMGRREYLRVYAERLDSWSRMYGVTVPKRASRDALDKAYEMIYKWPFEMAFGMISWLLTSEHLLGVPDSETDPWDQADTINYPDPTDELIKKLDRELKAAEYEEAKHGPLNTAETSPEICPCGYRTECHIHCGTGPAGCHYAMQRVIDATESRAVRNVYHPETGVRYDR